MSPTIRNQAKLAGIALAALMASTPFALAVSPSQEECEAAGGTFTKEQGGVQCVITEEEKVSSPNANPNNNAQTTTKDETTTGHGNIENKQQQTINCSGPPGQQDPACP